MKQSNLDETLPPHSLDAEKSVLGVLLVDNSTWEIVSGTLTAGSFFRPEHQLIFEAIRLLVGKGLPADVVTVFEHLSDQQQAEQAGGRAYLDVLAQTVPSAIKIKRYCEIVCERAVLRQLFEAGNRIVANALLPQGRAIEKIVDACEREVLLIGKEASRMKDGMQPAHTFMSELLRRLNDDPTDVTGVRTGFTELDRITAGLQPGELIVLASRPSMGKTALAINIASHVALQEKKPVCMFSMDLDGSKMAARIVGSVGKLHPSYLRSGKLNDADWPRLDEAMEKLRDSELLIDETPGLTVEELRDMARRQARKSGRMGLIIVDHLQLMRGTSSGADNGGSELREICLGLKMLAKELNCPVIALSQLNRSVESRACKWPMIRDLRGSGAIEKYADVILFLYRDEYYTKEFCKNPGICDVIVGKQRNGPVGTVELAYIKGQARFENLAFKYI